MITIHGTRSNGCSLHPFKKEERKALSSRCNLCKQTFQPEFDHQLFCGKCRAEDESFHFAEWLPQVPDNLFSKAS